MKRNTLIVILVVAASVISISVKTATASLPVQSRTSSEKGAANNGGQQHKQASGAKEGDHTTHIDAVNKRGDHEMGFSHAKTSHHFRLTKEGGAIEVEVNDPNDSGVLQMIRTHLEEIARSFKDGDFAKPAAIHAQAPPGVAGMMRLKEFITYSFDKTEKGGRVRIATENQEAVAAIHEFLRFQINEHETGDSTEISN